MQKQELIELMQKVSADNDGAEILLYQGAVDRDGYDQVSEICAKRKQRAHAVAILSTPGGDANAAFRIARCLGARYKKLTVLVPRMCKSAGTLICLGADQLVIADTGELGPLDVQVQKRDELGELGSGQDLLQTLGYLQENAYDAFRSFMVDIRMGSQMSTKIAAEMATELAIGLYGKIFDQIDPIKLGEMQRMMLIASDYGERLGKRSKNIRAGALAKLVSGYPTHSFVIDRREAQDLFVNVRKPTDSEEKLGLLFTTQNCQPREIAYLFETLDGIEETTHNGGNGKQHEQRATEAHRDGSGSGSGPLDPAGDPEDPGPAPAG